MKQQEISDTMQRMNEIILDRKALLSNTDYIAAKIAEGSATKEEYREQITERQRWREEINAAEECLAELDKEVPEDENPDAVA